MTHLAILTVRNEAAFLLEWLAHHRAVGFDHFLVFSNDCDDGTDRMLDHLASLGGLTHVRNPGPYEKTGIQFKALNAAARMEVVRDADWILALDIDEFVNIHVGGGTLVDLHTALPNADAITLTWRLFGNNGHIRYEDRPVTELFTQAAPEILSWPWRAAMFKTLYANNGIYRKPGVHRPRSPEPSRLAGARWYDGHGRALGDRFKKQRVFSDYGRANYGLVQLNHYPLGAMESYLVKMDRGRVNRSDSVQGLDYWIERNLNIVRDTSIRRYDGARNAELARLQSDPTLAELHQAAVTWRKVRFDQLMAQEPFRALFGRLLMAPPSQPLTPETTQIILGYAMKARAAGV